MRRLLQKMSPKTRTWVIRGLILSALVLIGYPLFSGITAHLPDRKQTFKILDNDPETFEEALFTKTKADIEQLRDQIKALSEKLDEKKQPAPVVKAGTENLDEFKATIEKQMQMQQKRKVPDPVRQTLFPEPVAKNTVNTPKALPDKNFGIRTVKWEGAASDQKPKKTISLPPSFGDASLLTGVIAPAAEVGKGHPIPMLFRMKEPAQLPNEVKEDLKGCFIIGEGEGRLDAERVKVRIVNLSCITKDGEAIIDQEVKGWVVDADGRADLAGRVVAKFGAHLIRTFIAGLVEGFGEAFELSVSELNSSNYWGQETRRLKDTETGTLATAGVGRGIARSADSLQEFYLKLAAQSLPVIEVGPKQNITIVISEGRDLVLKERQKL